MGTSQDPVVSTELEENAESRMRNIPGLRSVGFSPNTKSGPRGIPIRDPLGGGEGVRGSRRCEVSNGGVFERVDTGRMALTRRCGDGDLDLLFVCRSEGE